MKVLTEKKVIVKETSIDEVENEGLLALLGETITCFCAVYIYTGKLVGVNKTCIKLENPKIVYETGPFSIPTWKDAQQLPSDLYIQVGLIEAFGKVK